MIVFVLTLHDGGGDDACWLLDVSGSEAMTNAKAKMIMDNWHVLGKKWKKYESAMQHHEWTPEPAHQGTRMYWRKNALRLQITRYALEESDRVYLTLRDATDDAVFMDGIFDKIEDAQEACTHPNTFIKTCVLTS